MLKKTPLILALGALAFFFFSPAQTTETQVIRAPTEPPALPQIEARAALAQDFLTGEILFKKNEKTALPLASITKIIALLAVLDKISLDEEIEISKSAVLAPEPSSLRIGEHFEVGDLVAMAMVESSNDAITALYERLNTDGQFLEIMRLKAEILGANSMNFINATGLDETETTTGGYGSAEDLLKVTRFSLDSPIWQFGDVREIVSKEGIKHILKPTNELGPELTPLIGAKTGFTDLAGGNLLVIVEYPIGHPLGIVVLGSSEKGRFEDVKKILGWIKNL
ncbi:hypothetical protein A2926_02745 [Candidatus Giovannonibacteria bacterium RIFCSPLOWO2_01_FULL_44_40]|uniref:Peptidase S11 D-alanyl-D-alanine carboxypeptidase A N-terminal domain-containing protein n=1 Tax=Candidatus Giovannonibacteria bacterium RIFCSPHIGHO2_01_FULL_45_23 TaxID=1798325 RepID=A0A1F5VEH3_9BACT|nr:MAG: hypothetical protein A2834_00870 [Candidatus Giovannonibacteria bacterium RIFCSPHIGHO2_01_FULL_45_23]OGF75257.1 MAG: hypothetical protein A3C77_02675 [Candidatus Giovannonibacteria bacterium RIFCSPHIGHO2_02_FULL_45_13]OGF79931.1 MAG: hypothetical protein A2926_02745 [Candidatus Giovannonibacteria bacterium RIFCSPLOWO2_01_FULL_44_40]